MQNSAIYMESKPISNFSWIHKIWLKRWCFCQFFLCWNISSEHSNRVGQGIIYFFAWWCRCFYSFGNGTEIDTYRLTLISHDWRIDENQKVIFTSFYKTVRKTLILRSDICNWTWHICISLTATPSLKLTLKFYVSSMPYASITLEIGSV